MQIIVFGASGRVGQLVISEALQAGHQVRAFVHTHNPFTPNSQLVVTQGSITDKAAVEKAVRDCDAVISTLGSWHTKEKNVLTLGMQTIIPAMERAGVRRLVTLTGTAARLPDEHFSASERLNRTLFGLVVPKILDDGDVHLTLLKSSTLDWTCLRSPAMSNGSSKQHKLTDRPGWPLTIINRAAVASCLLELATTHSYTRQAPCIHPD